METIKTQVLIIGAGPAGLAVAAHLRKRNIPFEIVEKNDQVGSAWRRHYDRLHLHTVREKSHLPFLPFPDHYPRYVSRQLLCEYFDTYAETFGIKPYFHEEVDEISRQDEGWLVRTESGRRFLAGRVVVATGVNRAPYHPHFSGEEQFQGEIIHSRDYKNAQPFLGKRVLVIGMGNTGAEIALDLSEHNIETFLSVRSPTNIVPRDILGRPTQLTALMLARLPDWLSDFISRFMRRLTMGDMPRYGIPFPDISPARQLKETGKTPVVDIGTARAIRAGRIRVLPDLEHFDGGGALFSNGEYLPFHSVILATGYRANVDEFVPELQGRLDAYGAPRELIGQGPLEGLYFIGFDNYTPGGILGVINRDSAKIAEDIGG